MLILSNMTFALQPAAATAGKQMRAMELPQYVFQSRLVDSMESPNRDPYPASLRRALPGDGADGGWNGSPELRKLAVRTGKPVRLLS